MSVMISIMRSGSIVNIKCGVDKVFYDHKSNKWTMITNEYTDMLSDNEIGIINNEDDIRIMVNGHSSYNILDCRETLNMRVAKTVDAMIKNLEDNQAVFVTGTVTNYIEIGGAAVAQDHTHGCDAVFDKSCEGITEIINNISDYISFDSIKVVTYDIDRKTGFMKKLLNSQEEK